MKTKRTKRTFPTLTRPQLLSRIGSDLWAYYQDLTFGEIQQLVAATEAAFEQKAREIRHAQQNIPFPSKTPKSKSKSRRAA